MIARRKHFLGEGERMPKRLHPRDAAGGFHLFRGRGPQRNHAARLPRPPPASLDQAARSITNSAQSCLTRTSVPSPRTPAIAVVLLMSCCPLGGDNPGALVSLWVKDGQHPTTGHAENDAP